MNLCVSSPGPAKEDSTTANEFQGESVDKSVTKAMARKKSKSGPVNYGHGHQSEL